MWPDDPYQTPLEKVWPEGVPDDVDEEGHPIWSTREGPKITLGPDGYEIDWGDGSRSGPFARYEEALVNRAAIIANALADDTRINSQLFFL